MKIAIFTDTYFPQVSGVATSIKILKDTFEAHGHQVYIFTTTDPDAPGYEENIFRYESVPFPFFKERRIAVTFFSTVVRKVKQLDIDIIHTQTEFSMGMLGVTASRLLDIPLVHTYHTWYEKYLHYIMNGHLVTKETVKRLSRLYCQQADRVITPSEQIKNVLEDYGVERQIDVVATGVPIPEKVPSEKLVELRRYWGIEPTDFLMLSVNRLAYEKNLITIINKLPLILKQIPQAKLMLVGDGPERENLIAAVKEKGLEKAVIFIGAVEHQEVDAYYQSADVYVNVSMTETQGLTFLEAIANQLPVVAYASDYLKELESIEAFGELISQMKDLPNAILKIQQDKTQYESKVKTLLCSISAETFYEKMYTNYCNTSHHPSIITNLNLLNHKISFSSKRKLSYFSIRDKGRDLLKSEKNNEN